MKSLAFFAAIAGLAGTALAGGGVDGSGLVCLDQHASGALSLTGNSRVLIPARAVYVNSDNAQAVKTVGSATIDAPTMYVVGGTAFNGQSGCTGQVIRSATPYADPLVNMAFPTPVTMTNHGSKSFSANQTYTLQPGYYSGITVSGNSTIVMQPGNYIIGGSGFRVTSGTIVGNGVTIFMHEGGMSVRGTSSFILTPPSTGNYSGMVIAQQPGNTTEMSLAGGSEVIVSGTIYAPKATLSLAGNSEVEGNGPQMGDVVIANRVALTGTAEIRIGRADQQAISLPKLPLYD